MRLRGATIAQLCLVGIFPGFFFYHYLAGVEAIPLFAGGWASNVNVLSALLLLPFVVAFSAQTGRIEPHFPAIGFVIVVACYSAFFWLIGEEYQRDTGLLVHSAKLVLGLTAVYCIGFLLSDEGAVKKIALVAFSIMAVLITVHTDWSALTFTIPERVVPTGQVSDYQGFATAFAITAILAIAAIRPLGWLLAAILTSAACLFLIGSRGDMLGFGLAVFALAALAIVKKDYIRALAAPIAYAAPIILFLAIPAWAANIQAEPAVFETPSALESPAIGAPPVKTEPKIKGSFRNKELLDIGSSQSLGIRMEVLRTGWHGIVASPIIGDYAGQVRDHGQFGMYVHNVLSAWQQFGIVGFLLYAGLSLGAVGYSAGRILIRGDDSFLMVATLLVAVYSVGLVVLTKSVFWPMPALAWGMAAARYRESEIAPKVVTHPSRAQPRP